MSEYAPNTIYYSDSALIRIASFFCIILSSMLPVMAIVVLYRVAAMSTRLGLVGTFTAVFSVCLWFMTDGRLIEVFSATSAYVFFIKSEDITNGLQFCRRAGCVCQYEYNLVGRLM